MAKRSGNHDAATVTGSCEDQLIVCYVQGRLIGCSDLKRLDVLKGEGVHRRVAKGMSNGLAHYRGLGVG